MLMSVETSQSTKTSEKRERKGQRPTCPAENNKKKRMTFVRRLSGDPVYSRSVSTGARSVCSAPSSGLEPAKAMPLTKCARLST